ncbi:MAG: hypothetical protein JST66_05805 [Bacteroidetes bacterium]|nr:hypothetical protein [Bacteroidota bacterium]
MSRAEKGVIIGTIAVVLLILLLEALTPREPSWRESYTRYKREPFACGLVYDRLEDLFPAGVRTVHDPIYSTAQERLALSDSAFTPVEHIFINSDFSVDDLDLRHLLMMVERGDDAFIAGQWFGDLLRDTLRIGTTYHWEMPDSAALAQGLGAFLHGDTATLTFTVHPQRADKEHLFRRGGLDHAFDRFPVDSVQVLAVNRFNDPVLLRMAWGKGHFYLCTTPQAFTNYYLLRDEARGFMADAFSFLPDRPVLWDEFYKVGRLESPTPLRFVLSNTALKAAYWTVIALLALYVFVYAKRRQRAIPELVPLRNTSREFAETMGRLYYFRGDHTDLARKMALYFKDDLRHKLYLRRSTWDAETIRHIAERTGIDLPEWEHAFRLIDHYENAPYVSEEQLMQFNKTLSRLRSRL